MVFMITSLANAIARQIWNTPEGLVNLICELDAKYFHLNNEQNKDDLLSKLNKLPQPILDLFYRKLKFIKDKEASNFGDYNLLMRAINAHDYMLINLLLTEHCHYLNNDSLPAVLKLAREKNDFRIPDLIANALSLRLCTGQPVIIPDLYWKELVTQSICRTYYLLPPAAELNSIEIIQKKAWTLLNIIAKAKMLYNGENAPECPNEALAAFLATRVVDPPSFVDIFFTPSTEKDDCIDRVDSSAKEILRRLPKPRVKIDPPSEAPLPPCITGQSNPSNLDASDVKEHKSNIRNIEDTDDAPLPTAPLPDAVAPTSTEINPASSLNSSLRQRACIKKLTIKPLPLDDT